MVIKRVGGKSKIAEWIKTYLPSCRVFVDVFGGSGSILDSMISSRNTRLIFNDLDDKIYTFFYILRSYGHDFAHLVNLTPYSRKMFDEAMDIFNDDDKFNSLELIDKAMVFLIVNRQSFGAKMLPPWSITRDGEVNYETWGKLPRYILNCHNRWKNVFLENLDYKTLIPKWDGPQTTFYLDPPYEGVESDYYEVNKDTGFNHHEMFDILQTIEGSYAVSYYGGDTEDEVKSKIKKNIKEDKDTLLIEKYIDAGCKVYRKKVAKHLAGSSKKSYATEVLIVKSNPWSMNNSNVITIKGQQVGDLFD